VLPMRGSSAAHDQRAFGATMKKPLMKKPGVAGGRAAFGGRPRVWLLGGEGGGGSRVTNEQALGAARVCWAWVQRPPWPQTRPRPGLGSEEKVVVVVAAACFGAAF